MKMTYEEFIRKVKPEIKEDLKNHKEKDYLKEILDDFYNEKLETFQNENEKDFRLDLWAHRFYCCFNFIEYFENKEYEKSLQEYISLSECTGSFGYAIIKMFEELFYERRNK